MRALILAVLGGLGLVAGYWSADRAQPSETLSAAVIASVRPGDDALIEWRVFRHRACHTKVERSTFDGLSERVILPDQDYEQPRRLGEDSYRTRAPIPQNAAPGSGSIEVVLTWRCNPVHQVWPIVQSISVPVTILPR